jgi:hypothetical protein
MVSSIVYKAAELFFKSCCNCQATMPLPAAPRHCDCQGRSCQNSNCSSSSKTQQELLIMSPAAHGHMQVGVLLLLL